MRFHLQQTCGDACYIVPLEDRGIPIPLMYLAMHVRAYVPGGVIFQKGVSQIFTGREDVLVSPSSSPPYVVVFRIFKLFCFTLFLVFCCLLRFFLFLFWGSGTVCSSIHSSFYFYHVPTPKAVHLIPKALAARVQTTTKVVTGKAQSR